MSYNFFGEYQFSIDDKGRAALPSAFRQIGDRLIENWVITKGMEKTLLLYPHDVWQDLLLYLGEKLSYKKEADRSFLRFFVYPAKEILIDKQGRFLISKSFLDWCGIEKNIVYLGALNKIEIWSENHWEGYMCDSTDQISGIIEKLDDLTF